MKLPAFLVNLFRRRETDADAAARLLATARAKEAARAKRRRAEKKARKETLKIRPRTGVDASMDASWTPLL